MEYCLVELSSAKFNPLSSQAKIKYFCLMFRNRIIIFYFFFCAFFRIRISVCQFGQFCVSHMVFFWCFYIKLEVIVWLKLFGCTLYCTLLLFCVHQVWNENVLVSPKILKIIKWLKHFSGRIKRSLIHLICRIPLFTAFTIDFDIGNQKRKSNK